MPGVSIARRAGGLDPGALEGAVDSVRFFDDYEAERLVDEPHLAVVATGYAGYPIRAIDADGATVVLEGHLYDVEAGDPDVRRVAHDGGGRSDGGDADDRCDGKDVADPPGESNSIDTHLRAVADWVRADDAAALSAWVADRDGDFVVYVVDDAAGEVTAVTDAFGRLPLFHAAVGGATVLSRELAFVREFARRTGDPLSVDAMGVAQTLLFGYCLGPRTLFAGVRRTPPGSLARIGSVDPAAGREGAGSQDARITRLHEFSFGSAAHADRSVEENAAALASLFRDACRRRVVAGDPARRWSGNWNVERDGDEDVANGAFGTGNRSRTVVALSGGLDSRAVAAGLDAVGADFTTATFDRSDGSAADEVRAARAVAGTLDVEWREVEARESAARRATLLELKGGMNDLRLAFLLDFLGRVGGDRGATYVTGDGGDKAFPDHTPPRSFGDLDELVRYVVSSNRVFSPSEAAGVAGVSEDALLASVRDRLESYSEADLGARYVGFLVRERGMNWLFHGEDRNRYYHWSVSPFYSLPFFRYAMACPAGQKRGTELYRAFLAELEPAVLDVEYVNFGAPVTSLEYRAKQFVYDALARHPGLRSRAVDLLKRLKDDRTVAAPDVARAIREQVRRSDAIEGVLSADRVERIAGNPADHSEPAMYHLYTVTSLVERWADPADDGPVEDRIAAEPSG